MIGEINIYNLKLDSVRLLCEKLRGLGYMHISVVPRWMWRQFWDCSENEWFEFRIEFDTELDYQFFKVEKRY